MITIQSCVFPQLTVNVLNDLLSHSLRAVCLNDAVEFLLSALYVYNLC